MGKYSRDIVDAIGFVIPDQNDDRYTQLSNHGDKVRSHEQLKMDRLRDSRLDEGLEFREKI
ncbi:MAG TPA: hypothetical protein VMV80_02440 [Anaerolineales bacterium]|nr:hypothetical protein [Anaerolineales bacterium]